MHPRLNRRSLKAWRLSSSALEERIESATLNMFRERDATTEQYRQSEYILGCLEASRSYRRRFGRTLGRKLEELIVCGPSAIVHAIVNDWPEARFAMALEPSSDLISEQVRKSFAVAMDALSAEPAVHRPKLSARAEQNRRLEELMARRHYGVHPPNQNPPGSPLGPDEALRRAMMAAGLLEDEIDEVLTHSDVERS
jgi:hypothetical protein